MSIRRMMLFTLGAKIKNLIEAFKTRVFAAQGEFEAETCLDAQLTDLDNKGLLDSASFVLTPNGYEENLLFAVSPNTSAADLTVTRATTGTRVNADGLIEQVPYNLLQRSEEFDNSNWTKGRTTISANSTTAPNGLSTADKILETAVTNSFFITQSASVVNGTVYTFSVYIKAAERFRGRIRIIAPSATDVTFDLNAQTAPGGTIQSVGNGWFRISRTITSSATIADVVISIADASGNTTYLGDVNSGFFIWGAQLVQGTQPRDYFPTTNRFNVPRIDYSNGSCPSILVEPQRTNLVLRSEEFENALWSRSGVTITSNNTISPSGTMTADTVSISGESFVYQDLTSLPNTVYTFSFYVRLGTMPFNRFLFALRDNTNGVFIAQNLVPNVTLVTTEWRRVTYTFTTPVGCLSLRPYVYRNVSSHTVGDTFFIWGAQLEVGANATSYIPTVASTVTRNADVISKTGVSSLIGQTEGTLFLDFNYNSTPSTANGRLYSIFDTNEGVNSILPMILGFGSANINQFQLAVFSNGVVTTPISPSASTFVPFGRQKFAIAYNSSGYTVFRNGALFASNTGALPSSLSAIEVGCSTLSPTRTLGNSVNSAIIFKTRLTNSQLATLTTL